eukprot:Rhum_TRINITY_DN4256_c0_g1::Rhum_TRINITY_DN4256_c0_g1_i1::g.13615::m.13615
MYKYLDGLLERRLHLFRRVVVARLSVVLHGVEARRLALGVVEVRDGGAGDDDKDADHDQGDGPPGEAVVVAVLDGQLEVVQVGLRPDDGEHPVEGLLHVGVAVPQLDRVQQPRLRHTLPRLDQQRVRLVRRHQGPLRQQLLRRTLHDRRRALGSLDQLEAAGTGLGDGNALRRGDQVALVPLHQEDDGVLRYPHRLDEGAEEARRVVCPPHAHGARRRPVAAEGLLHQREADVQTVAEHVRLRPRDLARARKRSLTRQQEPRTLPELVVRQRLHELRLRRVLPEGAAALLARGRLPLARLPHLDAVVGVRVAPEADDLLLVEAEVQPRDLRVELEGALERLREERLLGGVRPVELAARRAEAVVEVAHVVRRVHLVQRSQRRAEVVQRVLLEVQDRPRAQRLLRRNQRAPAPHGRHPARAAHGGLHREEVLVRRRHDHHPLERVAVHRPDRVEVVRPRVARHGELAALHRRAHHAPVGGHLPKDRLLLQDGCARRVDHGVGRLRVTQHARAVADADVHRRALVVRNQVLLRVHHEQRAVPRHRDLLQKRVQEGELVVGRQHTLQRTRCVHRTRHRHAEHAAREDVRVHPHVRDAARVGDVLCRLVPRALLRVERLAVEQRHGVAARGGVGRPTLEPAGDRVAEEADDAAGGDVGGGGGLGGARAVVAVLCDLAGPGFAEADEAVVLRVAEVEPVDGGEEGHLIVEVLKERRLVPGVRHVRREDAVCEVARGDRKRRRCNTQGVLNLLLQSVSDAFPDVFNDLIHLLLAVFDGHALTCGGDSHRQKHKGT